MSPSSHNLIQLGDFVLSSGAKSKWKLVADEFIEQNLPGLVELTRALVGPFSSVEGVPTGGLKLAEALKPFRQMHGPLLLVEDVLTSGGSLERFRELLIAGESFEKPLPRFRYGRVEEPPWVVGVTVFARGQCPIGVRAIFQMPECFWLSPGHQGGRV